MPTLAQCSFEPGVMGSEEGRSHTRRVGMVWEVAQGLCVGASLSIVACGPQREQGAVTSVRK